jgi:drug/metabolite transporter (DMT)-like permease
VLLLAAIQFAVTGVLSLAVSSINERTQISQVVEAGIPILYGGLMSVGVAYTLQIVGQRKALPAHAAIILSLEALFAAIGGWIILHEKLSLQQIAGGLLMLAGLIVAQLHFKSKTSRPNT